MLVIRFSRVGRHNHAQYRIVVQEKAKAPTGKHLAIVGSYDPHLKKAVLKENEIKEFLANGAQPSDSVYNLLVSQGLIAGEKRAVKLPEKKVEETESKEQAEASSGDSDSKEDAEGEKEVEQNETSEDKSEVAPKEEASEDKKDAR